jgi:hypothetical protein
MQTCSAEFFDFGPKLKILSDQVQFNRFCFSIFLKKKLNQISLVERERKGRKKQNERKKGRRRKERERWGIEHTWGLVRNGAFSPPRSMEAYSFLPPWKLHGAYSSTSMEALSLALARALSLSLPHAPPPPPSFFHSISIELSRCKEVWAKGYKAKRFECPFLPLIAATYLSGIIVGPSL